MFRGTAAPGSYLARATVRAQGLASTEVAVNARGRGTTVALVLRRSVTVTSRPGAGAGDGLLAGDTGDGKGPGGGGGGGKGGSGGTGGSDGDGPAVVAAIGEVEVERIAGDHQRFSIPVSWRSSGATGCKVADSAGRGDTGFPRPADGTAEFGPYTTQSVQAVTITVTCRGSGGRTATAEVTYDAAKAAEAEAGETAAEKVNVTIRAGGADLQEDGSWIATVNYVATNATSCDMRLTIDGSSTVSSNGVPTEYSGTLTHLSADNSLAALSITCRNADSEDTAERLYERPAA